MNRKFPIFAVLLLIVAVVWLLSDLGILVINVPWLPVVLGVIAIGMIYNRFKR
ncbi:MAG: hypothetical protein KJ601_07665 [Nanoarchaeota archaeon]|nr:hypothetical protein [Nanoarchaeota archaeon]